MDSTASDEPAGDMLVPLLRNNNQEDKKEECKCPEGMTAGEGERKNKSFPRVPILPPKVTDLKNSETMPTPTGPRYGYSALDPMAAQGGPEYSVKLSCQTCPNLAQCFVTYYQLEKVLKDEEEWRSWCETNSLTCLAEHWSEYAYEFKLGSPKRHFLAMRYRYNVDFAFSDLKESPKSGLRHEIMAYGMNREKLAAAIVCLVQNATKEMKLRLCTPANFLWGERDAYECAMLAELKEEGG